MKRITANLSNRQFNALQALVDPGYGGMAKFVREAIQEKIDRDLVLQKVEQVSANLDGLLEDIRIEHGSTRRDLIEDNLRGLERIRADVGKSMRKMEEMQKTFILMLGGHLTGQPAPRPRRDDDDGPMPIPG